MDFLKINKIEVTEEYVDMYDLEVSDNHNFILENGVITHNSGKTFKCRGRISRYWKSGFNVVIFNDIKNEYISNNYPIQLEKGMFLGENEYPEAVPTVPIIPAFLLDRYGGDLPEGAIVFQISLQDLEEKDLLELFKAKTNGEIDELKRIHIKITRGEIKTLKEMKQEILKTDLDERLQRKMAKKIDIMIHRKFIGEEHKCDIVSLLNKRQVLDFCMLYADDGDEFFAGFYSAVTIRIIRRARTARPATLHGPTVFFIEEADTTVGKDAPAISRKEVVKIINKDRARGFSVDLITQYPRQLPDEGEDNILMQVTHFFLPSNIDKENRELILKDICNMVGQHDHMRDKWTKFMSNFKARSYHWIYVDRNSKDLYRLKPSSPLCSHTIEQRA